MNRHKRIKLAGCLAAATTAVAFMAPIAHAGDNTPENAERAEKAKQVATDEARRGAEAPVIAGCPDRTFAKVFRPWHDRALYTLAGGGDFENEAAGWTLAGPATLALDSSPFLLGDTLGTSSLELPAGASAVSPPICVARGFKSFRLVARSVGADQGIVRVKVLYANGKEKSAGRVRPDADWAPTRKLSLKQGLFRVHRRGSTMVQLRFTASAGTVRLDDVYVDPRFNR